MLSKLVDKKNFTRTSRNFQCQINRPVNANDFLMTLLLTLMVNHAKFSLA
ncbi:hypothetical protein RESH_00876 [Rhodopirellula europaea SH398]|uniref:Uncharacterized protein n=1 Tax=Rhodopirellula europaea SH398 TaxID=1263868 RepID=M5SAK5_9BACT|nr:hypothetical protein RESH_00876 [Rhodopirellula europaea SH398]